MGNTKHVCKTVQNLGPIYVPNVTQGSRPIEIHGTAHEYNEACTSVFTDQNLTCWLYKDPCTLPVNKGQNGVSCT